MELLEGTTMTALLSGNNLEKKKKKGSFDLGRKFIHFWSVNWKFVPEETFLSNGWALSLLLLTLGTMLLFASSKWCK
jgi:hypothetical protein